MAIAHDIVIPNGFDELQPEEQLRYVGVLLEKVESGLDDRLDPAVATEVNRRRELHRQNPHQASPAAAVRARLLAKHE